MKSRRFKVKYSHSVFVDERSDMSNPFTPTFGKVPAYLAGREYLEAEMLDAFDNGPGDPNLTSIFVGARGTGKTAMLGYLAREAQGRGWVAASVTAIPGMLDDILQQVSRNAAHLVDGRAGKSLTGVSLGIGGIEAGASWERKDAPAPNWRTKVTNVLDRLEEHGAGLLITVDEVDQRLDEMIELIAVYQHLVQEERRVALLMAGLPHRVSALLSSKTASFLRRAGRKEMGNIPDYEIEQAFRITAEIGGKGFSPDALGIAVKSAAGFPFMMQLVGFRSWNAARSHDVIGEDDVVRGAALAANDMKERVLRFTLDELSPRDLEFCRAMLDDDGPSCSSDIAERLNRSSSNVSTYKRRLLDSGVIQELGRTRFDFALPLLREYLPKYLEENDL